MWIRSQDGKSLINTEDISFNLKSIVSTTAATGRTVLGEYDNEKRCIEILDEIQNFITEIEYAIYAGNICSDTPDFIYQMPEK